MDKKTKAVLLLREQQDKLDNIHSIEFQTWIITTTEIIRTYLGEESGFYMMMKDFDLNAKFTDQSTPEQNIAINIFRIHDILVSSMEYLTRFGIKKTPNWIYTLVFRDWVLLFVTVLGCVFGLGWNAHKFLDSKSRQPQIQAMEELKNTIKSLRDSISVPNDSTINCNIRGSTQ